ncbi:MAG: LPS biosynthesis protein WbpP, partial [Sphingobacteriales bacterium]
VYNVAVGDRTSLLQMYNILKEKAGSDIVPEHGPDRAGDIRDSLADISKAQKLLGYNPKIRIEEGLKRTYEWFRDNQEFINR